MSPQALGVERWPRGWLDLLGIGGADGEEYDGDETGWEWVASAGRVFGWGAVCGVLVVLVGVWIGGR